MTTPLGRGLYDFTEAATLTGLRISRIREWFRSHPSRSGRRPLFISDYESVEGRYAISFHDLIDVFVAGQLREHKVSLQTVRKVYARMQVTLETEHPFCH